MPLIHFTPRILAESCHDSRKFYEKLGWRRDDCQIGFYADQVLLACDTGAIAYIFDGETIRRETRGHWSKLIEFLDMDLKQQIGLHNSHYPLVTA